MARIGHKKSRNGCSRCKERKVKCDERRPCGACVKLRDCCSLSPSSSKINGASSAQTPPDARARRREEIVLATPSASPPRTNLADPPHPVFVSELFSHITQPSVGLQPCVGLQPEQAFNWAMDLGLMNHYTSLTSGTLPGASLRVWQTEIPKEAISYPFLMHQILAVSAFHLASLQPARSQIHFTQALQHQQHAICGINAEVSNVTSGNCHALFAASSLLFIGALAASSPALHKTRQSEMDNIVDIFTLIRGVSGILGSSKKDIQQGSLGDFMDCVPHPIESRLLNLLLEKIPEIRRTLHENSTQALADGAIAGLQESIARASTTTPELTVAIVWPMTLNDDFLALLRERHPAALVIVAHYCTVLHAAGSEFWFMRGWGRCIATTIAECLTSPWKEYIEWPLAYIGEA
ncbi:hypothetical protein BGZ61DRAFT_445839 [Ilyonectria robusta]|uniref:uncharacterized protein n=1 Tax=Ilyonectria robusta TaxID=1079257 RepID=UPI001E8D7AE5|nr:uncharacterized protein BGZ61DRAFT_445839 [Ilyonectria robusta]KAH8734128.1 hypothetical protein BGZ61DRAFT_445839 [Ilyonectria robusta]